MAPLLGVSVKTRHHCRNGIIRPGPSLLALLLTLALVVTLASATASAHALGWMPVGPPGGNVVSLGRDPSDPDRIYLGTADGILYRSEDGGQRWHRLIPGFPRRGCSLDEIVVDPSGVVYVGYWEVHDRGGGLARSTDHGQTFEPVKSLEGESVRALALAPSDPRVIAAGTLTGVFLSRDAGATWRRVTRKGHPDLRNFESLAFDPLNPQVLYAGTWHLAWKTRNGGVSWAPIHRGMIDDSHVMTLTVDPRHPNRVYATACTGIYRSDDGAEQWTKLRGIPYSSRRTPAFAVDHQGRFLIAGTTEGLWMSDDSGETWARKTPQELVVSAVLAQPDGTTLLGTEEAGMLRSPDRGRSWVASNIGFSERFIRDLVFDQGRLIVAAWGAPRYGGVFVAPGPGGPWARLAEGLEGREVLSLALLGKTILAGTDAGIFSRPQGAPKWTTVPTRVKGRSVQPRVTELLVVPPRQILAATSSGLMHSLDGGRTWTLLTFGGAVEVSALAMSRRNPERIMVATTAGFFRSHDGAVTWKRVSRALGVVPHALAYVPNKEGTLLATTTGGLFRSSNGGRSWELVSGGLPHSDLTGIAVHPDGRTLYVSDFTRGGIFRSLDGGLSWERMPTNGLGSDRAWTVTLDPAAPDRLFAATSAGGLHALVPQGMTRWTGNQPGGTSRDTARETSGGRTGEGAMLAPR